MPVRAPLSRKQGEKDIVPLRLPPRLEHYQLPGFPDHTFFHGSLKNEKKRGSTVLFSMASENCCHFAPNFFLVSMPGTFRLM